MLPTAKCPRSRTYATIDGEVGENIEQVLPPAADSFVAEVMLAALDRSHTWDCLNVLVHQCQVGVHVASVKRRPGLISQFHVLLRHRPRSIAQAQELS